MEYVTVLKHPVIREIDNKCIVKSSEKYVTKPRQRRTGVRRLCSRKKQGLIIAGLLILTVLSYCCLLWLYTHVQALNYQLQNQNKQLEVIRAKIDDLLHVKIIELQNGGWQNDKKDLDGYRNTRTASSDTPHFYLNGSGRGTQGRFSWSFPQRRMFDGVNDHFGAETIANTGDVEKVTIKIPGMYFIFAKILANGRENRDSDANPPMGISLMKRTAQGSEEMMDISWTTQDDRGRRYPMPSSQRTGVSRSFPSDTMTVMGIYMLNVNDKIYVQRPGDNLYDEHERYFSGAQQAQFGAFLIERRTS